MPQYKYTVKSGELWLAKFNTTDPETGKIKTVYKRGFKTKREAKAFEENYTQVPPPAEPVELPPVKTYRDVYREYMSSNKHADLKESTIFTKENIFDRHIFPTFGERPITEISADDITAWQKRMTAMEYKQGKHLSPSFLRTIQSQFNSVINYALEKGYLEKNPLADVRNMGVKDKRIECWSPEEYERFAYQAMNYPQYYYAYEVLYWCGLRIGELFALKLEDVDFESHTIRISKTYQKINGRELVTSPKTPSSVRNVSMPAFLEDELKEYLGMLYEPQQTDRVFLYSKTGIETNFRKVTEDAGLKHITIHGLRHSHVSLLISKKYDIFEISKRIGHKSVRTTQDIYGHLFDGVQKTMASDLNDMRRKGYVGEKFGPL